MEANQITVSDADLRKGAEEGMDAFLKVFIDKYLEVTGGKINADTWKEVSYSLSRMDTDRISLIIHLPKRCVCLGQKSFLS